MTLEFRFPEDASSHRVCFVCGTQYYCQSKRKPQTQQPARKNPSFCSEKSMQVLSDINEVHGGDMFSKTAAPSLRNKVLALATASTYRPNASPD